jgi:hypothetical protein
VQIAFEDIFEFILMNAHIKGEFNHMIEFKIFIEFIVRLNCVVIYHQKGEIESSFGPLSGFWC